MELIKQNANPHVNYRGSFTQDELVQTYEKIDVVVIPRLPLPINEAVTPLKPLEALAFGKALILSDVGGLREVVEDYEGLCWFFRAGDNDSLADALRAAISHFDTHSRNSHRIEAMSYIKDKRSWNATATGYLSLYRRLL